MGQRGSAVPRSTGVPGGRSSQVADEAPVESVVLDDEIPDPPRTTAWPVPNIHGVTRGFPHPVEDDVPEHDVEMCQEPHCKACKAVYAARSKR